MKFWVALLWIQVVSMGWMALVQGIGFLAVRDFRMLPLVTIPLTIAVVAIHAISLEEAK